MSADSVSPRQHTEGPFRLSTTDSLQPVAPSRPLRADARRNREKVLAAASAVFAEAGLDALIEDIAQRAGLGVGTVYRHFPTKDALVGALAEAYFERIADIVGAAADREGDPWELFERSIWDGARASAADVSMCEIIARDPGVKQAAARSTARLEAATGRLIARAQASGQMRADAQVTDVQTIMCAFGHVAAVQHATGQMDWERYLEIMLDGLRAR